MRPEVEELVLEEVPDVTYHQIGGLGEQIEIIQDAIELPYIHKERFTTTTWRRPRACCSTARPAAARP